MKKSKVIINILICVLLGSWVIQTILSYHNYTRHIELYSANGWLWYMDAIAFGKYVLPIVGILLIVKSVIHKNLKN